MKRLLALLAAALFCIGARIEFVLPKEDSFALDTDTTKVYWSPTDKALSAADIWRMSAGSDTTIEECNTQNWLPPRNQAGIFWGTGNAWPCVQMVETSKGVYDTSKSKQLHATGVDGTSYTLSSYGTADGEHMTLAWAEGQNTQTANVAYGVWFGNWVTEDDETFYICAPAEGTIETSHFSCDYGSTMEYRFNIGTYNSPDYVTMYIKNAKCWYCCRDKDPTDPRSGVIEDPDNPGKYRYQANTVDSLKGHEMHTGELLCIGTKDTEIRFIHSVS